MTLLFYYNFYDNFNIEFNFALNICNLVIYIISWHCMAAIIIVVGRELQLNGRVYNFHHTQRHYLPGEVWFQLWVKIISFTIFG